MRIPALDLFPASLALATGQSVLRADSVESIVDFMVEQEQANTHTLASEGFYFLVKVLLLG